MLPEEAFEGGERHLSHPPEPVADTPLPPLGVPHILLYDPLPGRAFPGPARGVPPHLDRCLDAPLPQEGKVLPRVVGSVGDDPDHPTVGPGLLHQRPKHPTVSGPLVCDLLGHYLLRLDIDDYVNLEEAPPPPPSAPGEPPRRARRAREIISFDQSPKQGL